LNSKAKKIIKIQESELANHIGRLLQNQHATLAIAESCTGGAASQLVVQIPGSSTYYKGSIVAYTNDVKINLLGVKRATIATDGPVSQQTAIEMAQQVRILFNSQWGLAITGVAGPDGGTLLTPLGMVWMAIAGANEYCSTRLWQFHGNRLENIRLAAFYALKWLENILITFS
jgi:nicotinamide-nucleotide amidase